MTTSEITSPRAQLVEGLWQLKQVCEQQDDQGLRHLHFNTLLKDPGYRLEIIRRANTSRNPKSGRWQKRWWSWTVAMCLFPVTTPKRPGAA